MRSMLLLGCVLSLSASLSACTFVHMAPGAKQVKVLPAAPVGCEQRGEASVSVRHQVGFYERSDIQVRDELETLARNEGPGLGADSISPLGPPQDGSQRWALWRCGR
ncbi:MAG: DUF4156 domain-containing protein [Thermomonas sp.]|uniref:DUF4156 domain-containing protein n=1 Tax=Thermomonas sp. TaxID=1971895 RepID=UPI0039E24389